MAGRGDESNHTIFPGLRKDGILNEKGCGLVGENINPQIARDSGRTCGKRV